MKGIVLAGGSGTRLYPVTRAVSKQLLPIYDKPMIYYPLSVLLLAKIRQVLVISTPLDLPRYQELLRDGSQWGISLQYRAQEEPKGIAQALLIAEHFIAGERTALILGDNLFFGQGFSPVLRDAAERDLGATIFAYRVKDPERYGIVELDQGNRAVALAEKPKHPKSAWAVTGLYFYDQKAVAFAKQLKASARGELEITDLNRLYLGIGELHVVQLGRGFAWLDTGTHDSLMEAGDFIRVVQKRQGTMVACLEEIALANGWITPAQVQQEAQANAGTAYAEYLRSLLQ